MKKFSFLNSNMLKIIACITMLIDHMGFILFPEHLIFRIIGRISFPLFAFMIAEGCFYTRNKVKHLLLISTLGILMQLVLYFAIGMTDFSIFITFSVSIVLIYLIDYTDIMFRIKAYTNGILGAIIFTLLTLLFLFFTKKYNYFVMNYNFYGIIAPVVIYVIKKYFTKYHIYLSLIAFSIMFIIKAYNTDLSVHYYSFLALPFILFYNGKRGKLNLKYFFYIFYPLHFVILYGISMLLS